MSCNIDPSDKWKEVFHVHLLEALLKEEIGRYHWLYSLRRSSEVSISLEEVHSAADLKKDVTGVWMSLKYLTLDILHKWGRAGIYYPSYYWCWLSCAFWKAEEQLNPKVEQQIKPKVILEVSEPSSSLWGRHRCHPKNGMGKSGLKF